MFWLPLLFAQGGRANLDERTNDMSCRFVEQFRILRSVEELSGRKRPVKYMRTICGLGSQNGRFVPAEGQPKAKRPRFRGAGKVANSVSTRLHRDHVQ